jgi:large subunit ribosomal protein L29
LKKLRIKELRKLSDEDLEKRLKELKLELLKERGNIEMGGNIKNPGKIKVIRRDIARILTLNKEKKKINE